MPFFGLFSSLDREVRRALQGYWDSPAPGARGRLLGLALWPWAWLYEAVHRVRRLLYRRGVLPRRRLPRPVVSVGALRVGGSGKTPFVLWMAERLQRQGYRVAILTRGYRGSAKQGTRILLGPNLPAASAEEAGDEPCLLARSLPDVPVAVNRRRFEAGLAVLRSFPVDLFLMDDGFQHLELARDCDLVLIGEEDPGRLACLPRGPLREPASALADASVVVRLTPAGVPAPASPGAPARSQGRGAAPAPVHRANLQAGPLCALGGGSPVDPGLLRDRRVLAFCGIARPAYFWKLLAARGLRVEQRLAFPDHHVYSPGDCEDLVRRLSSVDLAVTTEKDAVKIAGLAWPEGKVFFLRVEVVMEDEGAFWDQLERAGVLGRGGPGRRPLEPQGASSQGETLTTSANNRGC